MYVQERCPIEAGVHRKLPRLADMMARRGQQFCELQLLEYVPSAWEEEWRTRAAEYSDNACTILKQQQSALVDTWMEPMNASFAAGVAAAALPAMQNNRVGWPTAPNAMRWR